MSDFDAAAQERRSEATKEAVYGGLQGGLVVGSICAGFVRLVAHCADRIRAAAHHRGAPGENANRSSFSLKGEL